MTVRIQIFQVLTGDTAIGYRRRDVPIVHVIHQAPAGARFQIGDHFETCAVCKEHGVTHEVFHTWYVSHAQAPQ